MLNTNESTTESTQGAPEGNVEVHVNIWARPNKLKLNQMGCDSRTCGRFRDISKQSGHFGWRRQIGLSIIISATTQMRNCRNVSSTAALSSDLSRNVVTIRYAVQQRDAQPNVQTVLCFSNAEDQPYISCSLSLLFRAESLGWILKRILKYQIWNCKIYNLWNFQS